MKECLYDLKFINSKTDVPQLITLHKNHKIIEVAENKEL